MNVLLDETVHFNDDTTRRAKENLAVSVMGFASDRFPHISTTVIDANLLEFKAMMDAVDVCKNKCVGVAECGGNVLQGELLSNGRIHLSVDVCSKRMPIAGTEVKRTKKNSGYFNNRGAE